MGKKRAGGYRGSVHGTYRPRWPHSRLRRPSCTAYTASAGADGRSVASFLSAPLPGPMRPPVPMPPCPTKPCEATLLLLPVASSPAQRSAGTAAHRTPNCTARCCAYAHHASPPNDATPASPAPPTPLLPVPVSSRALASSWAWSEHTTALVPYRRSGRVFYSRNPHCDCGLGQRS